jgi:hypothetical protein
MQWSRLGLSSLVTAVLLSVTGVANASSYDYSYNGMVIKPVPVSYGYATNANRGFYRGCYRVRSHHGMRHHMVCPRYRAYYVCQKYTYEITPQHRDVSCTQWKIKWKHARHWRGYK